MYIGVRSWNIASSEILESVRLLMYIFDQYDLVLTLKFLSSGLDLFGEGDPTSEGPRKTYNNIL